LFLNCRLRKYYHIITKIVPLIHKILILHIDEELISQEKTLLERDGATVINLSHAREAIEQLENINANLIIIGTEVQMINGNLILTVFRRITQVPILAVVHREELVYMLNLELIDLYPSPWTTHFSWRQYTIYYTDTVTMTILVTSSRAYLTKC